MALQSTLIPIRFGMGIDTKVDAKQQLLTTLRRAVNVTYETISSVKKRNGYDRIELRTITGTQVTGAQKLAAFKNELDVFANNTLYSFSNTLQRLSPKGPVYSVYTQSSPVVNTAYSTTASDIALSSGLEIHAWSNTQSEVKYSVKDNSDNSFLASNNLVGTGTAAKVVVLSNYAYIFYYNSTNLYYRRMSIATPETLEAAVTIANNFDSSNPVFDVQVGTSKIYVAYGSSVVAARLRTLSINDDGSMGSGTAAPSSPICEAITVFVDSNDLVNVFFASSTALKMVQYNAAVNTELVAETSLDATADVKNIGVLESANGNYNLWYEVAAVSGLNHYIKNLTADSTGAIVVAPVVFIRSLGMLARPYVIGGDFFIPTVFAPDTQSTSFVLDSSANVVAKFSVGVGPGLQTIGSLAHTVLIDADTALISSRYSTKLDAENGVFFSVLGVAATTVSHDESNPLQTAELGDNLHISGSVLRSYDGDEIAEHGFHMYPDTVTAGSTSASGGSMSNGSYGYVAVYRWTDNYGQEHRSAASANLDVTLSGGGSAQQQTIIVPSLRVTDKSEVVVELYRTEAAGSVYYLTNTGANTTSADTVSIVDTKSDALLISEQPLYTTGDVLDNGPAPSVAVLGVHTSSNRIFAVGEDRNLLIYSKIREPGKPVEWNEALVKSIDPIGGNVTALVSMDEKMIIFKQQAILFMSGSGPNNLGQQDNFTDPERVAIDVGCIEPNSVVLTPAGLMFQSEKGIYILSRSLGLQYIGAPVEEYNSLQITSAKIIRENNQVRFTTLDGECLVYNYYLGLWCTFDNHQGRSAEVLGTDYYYIRASNEVWKENATSYSDNGSAISMTIETAWMSLAGVQAFQRVYRMLVIGDYKSAHNLRVRASYDFNNAKVQEKLLNPVPDIVSGATYGDGTPYGSESPYGGDANVYQARFDFEKQKCQAIKLEFKDFPITPGEALSLSNILLEVGTKRGLFKPGQAKIKGLS